MTTLIGLTKSPPCVINDTLQEKLQKIATAIDKVNILDSLCQGLEPFNLDKYRALHGDVTWADLAQFVTRALAEIGAKFTWQNDLLGVEVPEALRQRPGVRERYERLTFDRRRALNAAEVELAGIGHPLVDVLLDYFRSPAFSGLTCIRQVDGVNGRHQSIVQFNFILQEHREGVNESLVVVPVADGREYLSEIAGVLARRVGRSCAHSSLPPHEAREVADLAVGVLLAQQAAAEPNVPREYHLDGVALIRDGS